MPDFPPPLSATPSAGRPLAGVTLLLVEDSRFASEAVRLLCLRSGARIRRADSLRAAERHLATYRPTAVLVDLGLPDGSGLDLVARLAAARPRLPAILATSGDTALEAAALAAGAAAFLPKPVAGVAAFQAAVLGALGGDRGLLDGAPQAAVVVPDRLALREDLCVAAGLIGAAAADPPAAYAARFLASVARAAEDARLADAAAALAEAIEAGADDTVPRAQVAGMIADRLAAVPPAGPGDRRIA